MLLVATAPIVREQKSYGAYLGDGSQAATLEFQLRPRIVLGLLCIQQLHETDPPSLLAVPLDEAEGDVLIEVRLNL